MVGFQHIDEVAASPASEEPIVPFNYVMSLSAKASQSVEKLAAQDRSIPASQRQTLGYLHH
jgi:hypothetical protein